MFRTFMDLIFVVSVAFTVLAFVLIPCMILSLGVLLMLGIDDRFVSPVVAYIAFPEAVIISGYLLLHYWRQITEIIKSITPW
ncbi:hypothetical protein LU674_017905 [Pseudomonas alloputida]|uniref:Uncharacterized protein n=3 Tax=Pseudomonas TaxID=286 RepID=A0A7W2JN25_9PSED|nr:MULTISPECIES: hypothetical protein [Pseudomonas]MCE0777538.1 hypothetical protein [Pseudomonas sp. NMI542_15]MBA1216472.1 hypothetical protein [Pseudomonas fulva]MBA1319668.1 hypothetical protein [Pseudomonas monteilii]MBA6061982.1 hypothetical protein [Pseudomonas juntendi]MBA6105085.1 hypothetical protein [Pseudomonas monteilii]